MKNGFKVIDGDLHLLEPWDLWEQRLPEPYRSTTKLVPPSNLLEAAGTMFEVNGKVFGPAAPLVQRQSRQRLATDAHLARARMDCTPEIWLEGLDIEGIDVAVLVPTKPLFFTTHDGLDPEHALALCRVYNDWAAEFTQAAPERFRFWGWLPRQDARLAAQEARRCVRDLGAVGVAMTSAAVDGHLLCDAFFDPLWEEVDALGVPFGLHVFGAMPDLQDDAVQRRYQGHPQAEVVLVTFSGLYHGMTSLAELVLGGVLERYQHLKPVIMETGASWLFWLLWRMDEQWEKYAPYVSYELSMKPSAYVRERCYITVDCDEDALPYLVDYGLTDNLLISTDYPHHDSPFPEAISSFLAVEGVSADAKRKILWDNPARLFGLGVAERAITRR